MSAVAPICRTPKLQKFEAWYRRTVLAIEAAVIWLDGEDRDGWDVQTRIVERCVDDLNRMSQPLPTAKRTRSIQERPYNPIAGRVYVAKPHAKAMLNAMRERRRAAALESGRAALAAM